VLGVTLAEQPWRGVIYTSTPEEIGEALRAAQVQPAGFATGESVTADNYYRVADSLRRDLRVAQVICLTD
jgi:serine protease Do